MLCIIFSSAVQAGEIDREYLATNERILVLEGLIQEQRDIQNLAQQLAAISRFFGLPEDSPTIILAQEKWWKAQEEIERLQNEIKQLEAITLHYVPTEKVGLSVLAFSKMLENTTLADEAQMFFDLEQNYNVNGVFAIGVATMESSLGKNCNYFNPYGMLRSEGGLIRFETWNDATMFFGKLMLKDWYYNKDIAAIAKTYCPPNHEYWATTVTKAMTNSYSKIKS